MGSAELEIVIAAAVPIVPARYRRPAVVDPFDVSHEMAMVKSALLYADHVSLASWRVSMVNVWARMREHRRAGDAAEVLRLLAAVEWAGAPPGVEEPTPDIASLARIRARDLTSDALESAVGDRLRELDARLDRALATASSRELVMAEELGVVEVRSMGTMAGVVSRGRRRSRSTFA